MRRHSATFPALIVPFMFAFMAGQLEAQGITSLNPSSIAAGAATFTLTVNGTNFVSGAMIEWAFQSVEGPFAPPRVSLSHSHDFRQRHATNCRGPGGLHCCRWQRERRREEPRWDRLERG